VLLQFDLFDVSEPDTPVDEGVPLQKKRRATSGWHLSDHACRFCFGRVLYRVSKGETVESRCAECGKQADGGPQLLCSCGADCGEMGKVLECFKNPAVTLEVPHEILVRERRATAAEREHTASARPVKITGF
jgi:hypothetical protein